MSIGRNAYCSVANLSTNKTKTGIFFFVYIEGTKDISATPKPWGVTDNQHTVEGATQREAWRTSRGRCDIILRGTSVSSDTLMSKISCRSFHPAQSA